FVAIVLYLYLRDNSGNNFRRARRNHNLGQKYHEKEDFEKSDYHYQLSKYYREKAMKQRKE
ncbi:MAG: hypothetical protein AABW92_05510, partial [Nanoarchaeota archaeon]